MLAYEYRRYYPNEMDASGAYWIFLAPLIAMKLNMKIKIDIHIYAEQCQFTLNINKNMFVIIQKI